MLLQDPLTPEFAFFVLNQIKTSLINMNKALNRMPEECSPEHYFLFVRPYIFSFENVVYEDCFHGKPQTFRGETGAQSSIIPAFLAALEIKHKDSMLTHHLQEMRDYMPKDHRIFLNNLENSSVHLREVAKKDSKLKPLYNECLMQLIDFREKHFEYAINYIANKVENPKGTGGTPYVPWLKQLKEETKQQILE